MKSVIKIIALSQLRRFFLMFSVIAWMSLIAGSAYCEDIPLPPEVQALVGMEIPPVIKGDARGSIPGFFMLGSSGPLSRYGINETADGRSSFGLETGVLANGRPMLFVTVIHKDLTTDILDALMLPPDLIDWYFEGDFEYAFQHDQAHPDRYFKWYWQAGQTERFVLSESCGSNKDDKRLIIGLIKQEKGKETCSHYSKRVMLAWLIDKRSGRLMPMPTRGLQCHYISEEDCY